MPHTPAELREFSIPGECGKPGILSRWDISLRLILRFAAEDRATFAGLCHA
jgi:hypothetical protein